MAPLKDRVLLLGQGGREHALAWHLSQSESIDAIFVAPGNAGTQQVHKTTNVVIDVRPDDYNQVVAFVRANEIDMVIPTQEQNLVNGIVDFLHSADIKCFGPTKLAARLEGSKAFAKAFMRRHDIPTGDYAIAEDLGEARAWVNDHFASSGGKMVIKASGITSGKGVFIVESLDEALNALNRLMHRREFGSLAQIGPIILEEFLEGPEFSVAALTDGEVLTVLPPFRDFKRLLDNDRGPNTGGMGAMFPSHRCPQDGMRQIEANFFQQTIDGMEKEASGPKAIEFDCRFGDPETQAFLPLIQGRLSVADVAYSRNTRLGLGCDMRLNNTFSVAVVVISEGYPEAPREGQRVQIGLLAAGTFLFYGGISDSTGTMCVSRGRVATVCGVGNSLSQARRRAYAGVRSIRFDGMKYREDIGSVSD